MKRRNLHLLTINSRKKYFNKEQTARKNCSKKDQIPLKKKYNLLVIIQETKVKILIEINFLVKKPKVHLNVNFLNRDQVTLG